MRGLPGERCRRRCGARPGPRGPAAHPGGLTGRRALRVGCGCFEFPARRVLGRGLSRSGSDSGRYPSWCCRSMTAAASACVVPSCAVCCGGQGSPAAIAAWCSRSMARSTASRSASNWRHHPAIVAGIPAGCVSPRRPSSALAWAAVSLAVARSARPCLVGGVRGLEPGRLRGHLAGQCPGVRGRGLVVLGCGVGGLPPGVGLGLRGEPQLAAHVRRRGRLGALAVEDPGLELAAGHGRGISAFRR